MSAKEELEAARTLIAAPEHWIKGQLHLSCAWNLHGGGIAQRRAWCAVGALRSVRAGRVAEQALLAQVPRAFSSVEEFNDHSLTTHADIIAMFQRAEASL